jgi:predicted negative regulator of RcsB-dependent stress response
MGNLDSHTATMLAVVVVLVLIALAAWYFIQKRQSERLQQRFGPEYGRAVDELGSRAKA